MRISANFSTLLLEFHDSKHPLNINEYLKLTKPETAAAGMSASVSQFLILYQ